MVDWQLAGKIAEGVAALQPSGESEPFKALVRPADESERLWPLLMFQLWHLLYVEEALTGTPSFTVADAVA